MIRRFIEWVLPLLILAAALCLLWGALSRGPSTPRSEAVLLPSGSDHDPVSGLVLPQSGASKIPTGVAPSGMLPASVAGAPLIQPPEEEPAAIPAGLATSASSSARPLSCASPCAVDTSAWDWATPVPSVDVAFLVRTGKASWMPERFGPNYLALPDGAGLRVRICGASSCRVMVSNDAGPSLAMQRAGRVADIAVRAWESICGVPRTLGLCPVEVTVIGRQR